jgi:hypothetical protein
MHLVTKNSDGNVQEFNVVLMSVNKTWTLQSLEKVVISANKNYLLRYGFQEGIPAFNYDFCDGSKSKLKILCEGLTILDIIKSMHDSWYEVKL